MRQEQWEPVDDFISRLRNLAAKYQFRDNAEVEDRVVDQLICGSNNSDIKKSLISRDKSLTLFVAIEIARSHEATSKHMKTGIFMLVVRSKKGNSATTAENNIRGENAQPMVHYVQNVVKLIIGNLSAVLSNGNNLTK